MSVSQWRVLNDNPVLGIRELFGYDPDTDTTYIKTQMYQVDRLLDLNRQEANAKAGTPWGEMQKVGSIPLNIFNDQLGEAVRQKDESYIRKWLNDSDHAKFRTREGTL